VETLTKYLAVAGGGAFGAVLRYYLGGSALSRAAAPFPLATFVINVTGSFVIGFFLTLVTERIYVNPNVRLAVAVGFVGAYTTFSTFEYDTARLVESKDYLYAFLNVVLSFVVGFAAVWAGIVAARRVAWMPALGRAVYERLNQKADYERLNREAGAGDEPRSVRARQKRDAGARAAVDEKDADEAHTGEGV
jgi:CrcB protein